MVPPVKMTAHQGSRDEDEATLNEDGFFFPIESRQLPRQDGLGDDDVTSHQKGASATEAPSKNPGSTIISGPHTATGGLFSGGGYLALPINHQSSQHASRASGGGKVDGLIIGLDPDSGQAIPDFQMSLPYGTNHPP